MDSDRLSRLRTVVKAAVFKPRPSRFFFYVFEFINEQNPEEQFMNINGENPEELAEAGRALCAPRGGGDVSQNNGWCLPLILVPPFGLATVVRETKVNFHESKQPKSFEDKGFRGIIRQPLLKTACIDF